MFLTVIVCMLAGSPCKALDLPPVFKARFETEQDCRMVGLDIERLYLQSHRDWTEGSVRCLPTPMTNGAR